MMEPATTSVIAHPNVLRSSARLRPRIAALCHGGGETTLDAGRRPEDGSTRVGTSSTSSKNAMCGVMSGACTSLSAAENTFDDRLSGLSRPIEAASSRPASDKASLREREPARAADRPRPALLRVSVRPSLTGTVTGASLMSAFRPAAIMLKSSPSGQCRLHCKNTCAPKFQPESQQPLANRETRIIACFR